MGLVSPGRFSGSRNTMVKTAFNPIFEGRFCVSYLKEGGGFRPLQISAVDEDIKTKIGTHMEGPMMNTFQKKNLS